MPCGGTSNLPPPAPAFDNTVYAYPEGVSAETMDPAVFGPKLWDQLHRRALVATPLWRESQWLNAFHAAIPCPICREHFGWARGKYPADFTSNDALFVCTWRWHQEVNLRMNKPDITLEAARALYS